GGHVRDRRHGARHHDPQDRMQIASQQRPNGFPQRLGAAIFLTDFGWGRLNLRPHFYSFDGAALKEG
ncbi:MAG: hypothetical protein ACOCOW_03910, partial [Prevotella sp.]